jgi:hypothetical protein
MLTRFGERGLALTLVLAVLQPDGTWLWVRPGDLADGLGLYRIKPNGDVAAFRASGAAEPSGTSHRVPDWETAILLARGAALPDRAIRNGGSEGLAFERKWGSGALAATGRLDAGDARPVVAARCTTCDTPQVLTFPMRTCTFCSEPMPPYRTIAEPERTAGAWMGPPSALDSTVTGFVSAPPPPIRSLITPQQIVRPAANTAASGDGRSGMGLRQSAKYATALLVVGWVIASTLPDDRNERAGAMVAALAIFALPFIIGAVRSGKDEGYVRYLETAWRWSLMRLIFYIPAAILAMIAALFANSGDSDSRHSVYGAGWSSPLPAPERFESDEEYRRAVRARRHREGIDERP